MSYISNCNLKIPTFLRLRIFLSFSGSPVMTPADGGATEAAAMGGGGEATAGVDP